MIKLTKVERLILLNQYEILQQLKGDSEYYEANMKILSSGYELDYHSLFGSIDDDVVSTETCEETIDILSMFRRLDNAMHRLGSAKISQLGTDVKKLKFQGFDANHDKHYYYTKFMIEKQGKWNELENIYLNSHNSYTITIYRKMLAEFNTAQLMGKQEITLDDLKSFISKI